MSIAPYQRTCINVSTATAPSYYYCLLCYHTSFCIPAKSGIAVSLYHHCIIGNFFCSFSSPIISHHVSYCHADISYASTTQYHCQDVSTITPLARLYRLSYYHTDTPNRRTAPYAWITVTKPTPALHSRFLSHQHFAFDRRLLNLIRNIKSHTSAPVHRFAHGLRKSYYGPLPLCMIRNAERSTLLTFSAWKQYLSVLHVNGYNRHISLLQPCCFTYISKNSLLFFSAQPYARVNGMHVSVPTPTFPCAEHTR